MESEVTLYLIFMSKTFIIKLLFTTVNMRRPGEPRWAESSHMVTKIILFCIFCAYLTYSINQVVTSPTSILSIQQQNETVPTPGKHIISYG